MKLTGFHHLTAITANARGNHDFYTQTLGLRLVKKTVNQDDVSAYHLFYADGLGTPGTDITFFDWPMTGERPINIEGGGPICLSWRTSRLRREVSSARSATGTNRSALNGFSMKS